MRLALSTKEEIQRLKALGHKKNTIASKLNIDWRTVDRYWNSLAPKPPSLPDWAVAVDWPSVFQEIDLGVKATDIYQGLQDSNNDLPSYSSFTRILSKIKKENCRKNIVIRFPKTPGKSLEVDYSGNSIPIFSPSSEIILKTDLFVGCLPFSSYIFAEFTYTQKLENFISSHVNMFEQIGGVPLFLIPDNAKVAVDKAHRYDPKLNLTYQDMAEHYNVGVSPARVRKPKDKPSVERAVGLIQQHFFPKVKNKKYTSLYELNCDLKKWLKVFNSKIMKGREMSREDLLKEEKKYLMSLPEKRYEFFFWKNVKVHPDCHFQFDKNYYSVPSRYVGEELVIKYNSKIVMTYLQKDKVCSHSILKGHGHYQTNLSHYPEKKLAHYNYSIQHALKEASRVGENTKTLILKLLNNGVHPLANLRKIQGILRLRNKYSIEDLDGGCEMALEANKLFYQYVNNCAKNYKYISKVTESLLPKRDRNLICLQGGFNNDGSTKTPSNA